jgi:hypothetical protein
MVGVGEVDLHDPLADPWVGEVGLYVLDRVGVRVEEQSAMT